MLYWRKHCILTQKRSIAIDCEILDLNIAAYIFYRAGKKDKIKVAGHGVEESKTEKVVSTSPPMNMDTYAEESLLQSLAMEPVKIYQPIPEEEKRELFKWILEEKRKVKPNNHEEKKQIDEEKATLKQFIRAESIPDIQLIVPTPPQWIVS